MERSFTARRADELAARRSPPDLTRLSRPRYDWTKHVDPAATDVSAVCSNEDALLNRVRGVLSVMEQKERAALASAAARAPAVRPSAGEVHERNLARRAAKAEEKMAARALTSRSKPKAKPPSTFDGPAAMLRPGAIAGANAKAITDRQRRPLPEKDSVDIFVPWKRSVSPVPSGPLLVNTGDVEDWKGVVSSVVSPPKAVAEPSPPEASDAHHAAASVIGKAAKRRNEAKLKAFL